MLLSIAESRGSRYNVWLLPAKGSALKISKLVATLTMAVISSATMANEKCSDTLYGWVGDGYVFQDIGFLATSEPVYQGGNTLSCGKWDFDVWTSYQLSSGGKYGNRGLGDEWDASVFYNDHVGPIALQASVQYYALAFTKSLTKSKDDLMETYVDASHAFDIGRLKLTPFLRVVHWWGVDTDINPAATVVRPGFRFALDLGHGFSVSGDLSNSINTTGHTNTDRLEVKLGKTVSGTSLQIGLKATERVRSVWSLGFVRPFK